MYSPRVDKPAQTSDHQRPGGESSHTSCCASTNTDGIVIDHSVHVGNPNDIGLLGPAIARVKERFGKAPKDVTADRGYCDAGVEAELTEMGVGNVVIPHKGKATPEHREKERTRKFRRLVKWRTGVEGRISVLKHSYSMDRTLMDGIGGT